MHIVFNKTQPCSINTVLTMCLIICAWCYCSLAYSATTARPVSPSNDIRVLIDVSGSMKKNDPANLRLPALRLLVGLLPADSSAAVWNFGTKATPIVQLGIADNNWKKNALKASKKIHSNDLFTNIGAALEAAITDWHKTPKQSQQRNIILLTDGMIDISKDDKKNQQERSRILNQVLFEIQQTGAKIHTIALSKNADKNFLQQLSSKTDGGFEQTESAQQLERIFLRLFEKSTNPDTIPLTNNKFVVDDSVFELTLLVFKPKNSPITEVIEPDETQYNKNSSPHYAKWQSEKNYDLITISRPKTGEWRINAQTDPDNRVLVVTNLQLQTNRLPNNLFVGEKLNIALSMTDNNKKITNDNFLQFISISAQQETPEKKRWFLHDNGLRGDKTANDGIFNVKVSDTLKTGKNTFTFLASTETLQRQIKHSVLVHDTQLINTRTETTQQDHKNVYQILVSPNIEFINPRQIHMTAQLIEGTDPETETSQTIQLEQRNPNVLEWSYQTDSLKPGMNYHVVIHMLTKTRTGRPVDYSSLPIRLNLPKLEEVTLSPDLLLPTDPEPEQTLEAHEDALEQPAQTTQTTNKWLIGIIIAVIANLVFGIGGWFAYRKWKTARETAYQQLTGELE